MIKKNIKAVNSIRSSEIVSLGDELQIRRCKMLQKVYKKCKWNVEKVVNFF